MGAPGTTPGPWRVVVNQTNINVSAYVGGRVALMAITPYSPHSAEGLANAHQNAASPDLYEAARILASLDEGDKRGRRFPTADECDLARKALAKARGE